MKKEGQQGDDGGWWRNGAPTHKLGMLLGALVEAAQRVLEEASELLQRLGRGLPIHGGVG